MTVPPDASAAVSRGAPLVFPVVATAGGALAMAAWTLGWGWPVVAGGVVLAAVSIWMASRGGTHPAERDIPESPRPDSGPALPVDRPRTGGAEAQVRDLRSVIEALDEAVLVTGPAGPVELCNGAAERLLGKSGERVLGRPVEDLFTQVDVLGLHASAAGGRAQRGQVRIVGEAGPRVYEVLAAPLAWRGAAGDGPSSPGVVLTFKDVTELALAVSLKTDFVANASHEFRTPLSSIKAAVETLADGAADEPGVRDRFLRMISGNVVRLEEMTRDLLDLSRLESPETPVSLGTIATEEITAALGEVFESACAERKVGLRFEIAPGLSEVRSDRRLLLLVLKNLIDNALKFAYEGTEVRVTAEELPKGSAAARPVVRWQVIDRGVGIPLGSQARVFERFYQVDLARTGEPARRGTGLGLAIVKHAVRALGGTVTVQSVWKEGTTMTVELPSMAGPG